MVQNNNEHKAQNDDAESQLSHIVHSQEEEDKEAFLFNRKRTQSHKLSGILVNSNIFNTISDASKKLKEAMEQKLEINQESSKAKPLTRTISRKFTNISKATNRSAVKGRLYKAKIDLWKNDAREFYWWDRRVEKLCKKIDKKYKDHKDGSFEFGIAGEQLGVEDSYLSYKSMVEDAPLENMPSLKNENLQNKPSMPSVSNSNPSLNVSKRYNHQNSKKNFLTSKDMAKDILNRSGVFSGMKGKNKITRMTTQIGPLQSGLMNKSSVPNITKSKSKPKNVTLPPPPYNP